MMLRALLSVTLALALALVGFGHQTLAPQDDAQASAYVLAGGSWADICGQSGDQRGGSISQCQACIIAKSCTVGSSPQTVMAHPLAQKLNLTASYTINHLSTVDWANGARAPPLA